MNKTVILFAFLTISLLSFSQDKTVSLFNGKDLTNWHMLPDKEPGFEVKDNILITTNQNGSDLFTDKWFGNYTLKFEYLLSKVGNSGVLIRSNPENPWGTGYEIQLLAPWTPYRDDLHCTGSIYGYVAVHNRPDETTDIWHDMEITCDRKMITISVDGEVTTMANTDTVEAMKDKNLIGAIGFQTNHSHVGEYAKFRNITIRDFDIEPDYVAKGFYDEDVRLRELAYKSATSIGAPMVEHLAKMMSEENVVAQAGAKQVLFDIAAQSTAPEAPKAMKKDVTKVLKNSLKKNQSKTTADYLKWLLAMVTSK